MSTRKQHQLPLSASERGSGGEVINAATLHALLTEAYPARDPSDALHRRVAELAARTSAVPSQRRSLGRWPLIGVGLAGATAVAVTLSIVAPLWTAAQFLRRVEAATSQVKSMHGVSWNVDEQGRRIKSGEHWESAGRYRSERTHDGRVSLFADGKLWEFEPRLNRVTVRRQKNASAYASSGYTVTAMLRDSGRWSLGLRLRHLGETVLNGRRYREVVMEESGSRDRGKMLVEVDTDLPVRMERQQEVDGQWITRQIHELRYNEPLPASFFAPNFPKTAAVFDADAGREEWRRRLAPGIARQKIKGRMIVIRDIQVNAEGDVFVLYTAGKRQSDDRHMGGAWAGRDWRTTITDDRGTTYLSTVGTMYMPTMARNHPTLPNGYILDGERLDGDWWIPVEPQSPWKPRRFTLRFAVSPVNTHGRTEDPSVDIPLTEHATFDLAVERPATASVPDYMPYLATEVNQDDLVRTRDSARGQYYRNGNRDPERALAFYRDILRRRDERVRETGEPSLDPHTWFAIGDALRETGRREEAIEAFRQAVRETSNPRASVAQDAQLYLERTQAELAWSPGRTAPGFRAKGVDGETLTLDPYRGQVLLIHAWTTFNESAKSDAAHLKWLAAKHSGDGLAILPVCLNFSNYEKDLRDFVRAYALPWPQAFDGQGWLGQAARQFGFSRTPMTILVGRDGVVRHVGLRGAALEQAVAKLME